MPCNGCERHLAHPRHTLRFWAYDDDCGPEGRYAHVDPSGSVYPCRNQDGTAPAILNDHDE